MNSHKLFGPVVVAAAMVSGSATADAAPISIDATNLDVVQIHIDGEGGNESFLADTVETLDLDPGSYRLRYNSAQQPTPKVDFTVTASGDDQTGSGC